jgi:ATP-binding cassette, subfamily G (WHITE), member 2, PDR
MLFQQFDRLLLLTFGGKTVYYGDIGENSKTMTSYFERHGASPCAVDENPAEWMLRAIGAAPGAHTDQDWFETWRNSPEYAAVRRELHNLGQQRSFGSSDARVDKELKKYYATPFFKQLGIVIKRNFQQYNRTPSYIYAKLILCGLTVSTTGYQHDH